MTFEKGHRDFMLRHLKEIISEERWERFHSVISNRTRYLTVVLEDIFQPHNASAVIRSCELMGIQDVHVIENRNFYELNPEIVVGSDKWVDVHRYNKKGHNTLHCYEKLKEQGYKIVATRPQKEDCLLTELPLDSKVALVMGTEKDGLSEIALNNADTYVKIPMYGFTDSYNISVSAALLMYELTARMRKEAVSWQLSQQEYDTLLLEWSLKTIRNPRTFIRRMKLELDAVEK